MCKYNIVVPTHQEYYDDDHSVNMCLCKIHKNRRFNKFFEGRSFTTTIRSRIT